MEADVNGSQRKVLVSSVAPLKPSHGDSGIAVRRGRTLPFVLRREWSAPAGHYQETWYLVVPSSREVVYEGPTKDVLVWGLQALTELVDEVVEPIPLEPGTYEIVFSLGRVMGGTLEVEAVEAPEEEAA
ncbi:MAG TPA: hypothetical protein VIG64_09200 [Actinomycetota bacterium]|jgi:hypothetical protein